MRPQFPVYIVSKGRWQTPFTARALTELGVEFKMVVESQEAEAYRGAVGAERVLILDPEYQRSYDTFDRLGDAKGKGPGPARNFVWEHALAAGSPWHWVMDDNIKCFYRWNKNLKVPVSDGAIFLAMEDFVLRYTNIAMAGPNYFMFASRKSKAPPFVLNTRIYSCNLIRTDTGFRWRGRYNEDTDLSLRMLKAGWCTVQFNAFLQEKLTTQTVSGGNTAEFYAREGTGPKSQMLVAMHPDVSRIATRFKRIHHIVDYSGFKSQQLILRPDGAREGVNNFGMTLINVPRRHKKSGGRSGAAA